MSGEAVIGVDIGGTKIAAAVVGADEAIGETVTMPTPVRGGIAVARAVTDLLSELPGAGKSVRAIGVGTAGVVDADGGIRAATDTIPGWLGIQLGRIVAAATGLPVVVLNDGQAGAYGEFRAAASTSYSEATVLVGTGIGGGVVVDGHVLIGQRGLAGNIGHVGVRRAAGLSCSCGRLGHLEALAAGPAMIRAYEQRSGERVDGPILARRWLAGDPGAREIVTSAATALGTELGALATVLDADRVVIGGGVVEGFGDEYVALVADAANAAVAPDRAGSILTRAVLGGAAVLYGAAAYARERTGGGV